MRFKIYPFSLSLTPRDFVGALRTYHLLVRYDSGVDIVCNFDFAGALLYSEAFLFFSDTLCFSPFVKIQDFILNAVGKLAFGFPKYQSISSA